MASALLLAIALAASDPTAEETIERRAGILTGIGCAFLVGGGVALGGSLQARQGSYIAATTVLFTIGISAIAAALFAALWPDDSWLAAFAMPQVVRVR